MDGRVDASGGVVTVPVSLGNLGLSDALLELVGNVLSTLIYS